MARIERDRELLIPVAYPSVDNGASSKPSSSASSSNHPGREPDMQSKPQKEGSESEQFWDLLGGKSEYPSQKVGSNVESDPHLFSCSFSTDSSSILDQKIAAALCLIVPREKRGVPIVAKYMQKLSMISPNGEGLDRCNWITTNSDIQFQKSQMCERGKLLFCKEDISPSSTKSKMGIQQLQIHFEEHVSSDVDQAICIRTSMEDEESTSEYVEAVLLGSGLNWDEYLLS